MRGAALLGCLSVSAARVSRRLAPSVRGGRLTRSAGLGLALAVLALRRAAEPRRRRALDPARRGRRRAAARRRLAGGHDRPRPADPAHAARRRGRRGDRRRRRADAGADPQPARRPRPARRQRRRLGRGRDRAVARARRRRDVDLVRLPRRGGRLDRRSTGSAPPVAAAPRRCASRSPARRSAPR